MNKLTVRLTRTQVLALYEAMEYMAHYSPMTISERAVFQRATAALEKALRTEDAP